MKQKTIISLIFLSFTLISYGQHEWDNWDKNYKAENFINIINNEKKYADSIEANPKIVQYYLRLDKYKIAGQYMGKSRPIDKEVFKTMKNVYKLFIGNPDELDKMVYNEFLFEINGKKVWFPIQRQLEASLKKEIKKGQNTTLYCLFFNEHSVPNVLYNVFLISEFRVY